MSDHIDQQNNNQTDPVLVKTSAITGEAQWTLPVPVHPYQNMPMMRKNVSSESRTRD